MAEPRFSLPSRSVLAERAGSAIAFALLLAAWTVAYVTVMPADPAPVRHVAALQVRL